MKKLWGRFYFPRNIIINKTIKTTPEPNEHPLLQKLKDLPITVLVGLPALFSTIIPLLLLATEGIIDNFIFTLLCFFLAYFSLPFLVIIVVPKKYFSSNYKALSYIIGFLSIFVFYTVHCCNLDSYVEIKNANQIDNVVENFEKLSSDQNFKIRNKKFYSSYMNDSTAFDDFVTTSYRFYSNRNYALLHQMQNQITYLQNSSIFYFNDSMKIAKQNLFDIQKLLNENRKTNWYNSLSRIRKVGILFFFLSIIAIIIFFLFNNKQENETSKNSITLHIAILVFLLIPLLYPIDKEKINPQKPLETVQLSNWYFPSFIGRVVEPVTNVITNNNISSDEINSLIEVLNGSDTINVNIPELSGRKISFDTTALDSALIAKLNSIFHKLDSGLVKSIEELNRNIKTVEQNQKNNQ